MPLKAKVRDDSDLKSVMAFEGREFVKSEFRPVPPDREAEAEAGHPHLVIEKVKASEIPEGVPHVSAQTVGGADANKSAASGGGSVSDALVKALEGGDVPGAEGVAQKLAGAGLDTVAKVRGAEKSDLTAISGIGEATATKIMAAVEADLQE